MIYRRATTNWPAKRDADRAVIGDVALQEIACALPEGPIRLRGDPLAERSCLELRRHGVIDRLVLCRSHVRASRRHNHPGRREEFLQVAEVSAGPVRRHQRLSFGPCQLPAAASRGPYAGCSSRLAGTPMATTPSAVTTRAISAIA